MNEGLIQSAVKLPVGDLVLVDNIGSIVRLTLNRPDRHNSLIPALLEDMLAWLSEVRENDQVRALILAANGRSFSTGGDVGGFYEHLGSIAQYANRLLELLNETILTLMNLPVPVVAAVHGIVTGGSLGLVLAADVVLVAPHTGFTPYYSVVGFSPDGGWTALLPYLIGTKRVAEVLMTNRTITAEQALDWGLASRIVPAEEIRAEAVRVAEVIASMKPGSMRSTKALLSGSPDEMRRRLDAERLSFVKQVQTDEARLGMEAFLNKSR
jgi:2-(1,2-epoxy-1,2-dihydrophenyl)acetyl-CoA isomerase